MKKRRGSYFPNFRVSIKRLICRLAVISIPLAAGIQSGVCDGQQSGKSGQGGEIVVIEDEDFKRQPSPKHLSLEDLGLNQPESDVKPPLTFRLNIDNPNSNPYGTFASPSSGTYTQTPDSQSTRDQTPNSLTDGAERGSEEKSADNQQHDQNVPGVAEKPSERNGRDKSPSDSLSKDAEDHDSPDVDKDDKGLPTNSWSVRSLTDRKSLPSTVQMIISVAAISLVPAILLMTTCFIRIVVVLGILRQAIGLQQLPPAQVTTALALMLTFLIMAPTWKQVKQEAIDPYSAEDSTMTWDEAWQKGVTPIKKFMWQQIQRAENENDFWIFYDYLPLEERSKEPTSFEEIPLKVLLPAFMISELKVAFLIGIQVLLPFLILDIVVASLCNTMGLIMMPPTVVSLPLKLLLFVMVDGWNLIVAMLLDSFSQIT